MPKFIQRNISITSEDDVFLNTKANASEFIRGLLATARGTTLTQSSPEGVILGSGYMKTGNSGGCTLPVVTTSGSAPVVKGATIDTAFPAPKPELTDAELEARDLAVLKARADARRAGQPLPAKAGEEVVDTLTPLERLRMVKDVSPELSVSTVLADDEVI